MQGDASGAPTPACHAMPKKRGRIAEEVEDKLMLKRAETDASGKAVGRLKMANPTLHDKPKPKT